MSKSSWLKEQFSKQIRNIFNQITDKGIAQHKTDFLNLKRYFFKFWGILLAWSWIGTDLFWQDNIPIFFFDFLFYFLNRGESCTETGPDLNFGFETKVTTKDAVINCSEGHKSESRMLLKKCCRNIGFFCCVISLCIISSLLTTKYISYPYFSESFFEDAECKECNLVTHIPEVHNAYKYALCCAKRNDTYNLPVSTYTYFIISFCNTKKNIRIARPRIL